MVREMSMGATGQPSKSYWLQIGPRVQTVRDAALKEKLKPILHRRINGSAHRHFG